MMKKAATSEPHSSTQTSPGSGASKPISFSNVHQLPLKALRSTDSVWSPGHSRNNSFQEEFTRKRNTHSVTPMSNFSLNAAASPSREIPSIFRRRSRSPASMSPAASTTFNSPARRNSSSSTVSAWKPHPSGVSNIIIPGTSTLPPLQENTRMNGNMSPTFSSHLSPICQVSNAVNDNNTIIDNINNPDSVTAVNITPTVTPEISQSFNGKCNDDGVFTIDDHTNNNLLNESINNEKNNGFSSITEDEESEGDDNYVLHVKCSEVMVDKATLGVVVAYVIQVTQGMSSSLWEIARRFKQFYSVNLDFRRKFPAEHIPELPSRITLGSRTDPKVIKERMEQLQKYLNEISKIPAITTSEDFKKFIDFNTASDLYPLTKPVISGVLTKTRGLLHTNYSSFVALIPPLLVYYDSADPPKPLDAPRKILHLDHAAVKLDKDTPSFVVTIKSGYLAKFSSNDRILIEKWVMMLRKAIDDATAEGDKKVSESCPKQPQKNQQNHIIPVISSPPTMLTTPLKDKTNQQQQPQPKRRLSSGNGLTRSTSIASFNTKVLLTDQEAPEQKRKQSARTQRGQGKKSTDFANIVKYAKQNTDNKLRGIINSLQSPSSPLTFSSGTSSASATSSPISNAAQTPRSGPSTPRFSPELSKKLIEIAMRIILADTDDLIEKKTCRDCIQELQNLEEQEGRHHAIRFMIHDISGLSCALEAKRGHDLTERRNFHDSKQHSTNELPLYALPGKFDDSLSSTFGSTGNTMSTETLPTGKPIKTGHFTSKTPTEITTSSSLADKDDNDVKDNEMALQFIRRGNSTDICKENDTDDNYIASSFPNEKFLSSSLFTDSTETSSNSKSNSKNNSFSDLQQTLDAPVNRFLEPSELENISSTVSSKKAEEFVVCRNCDESFYLYQLWEHTDYCIPAVTLATQDKSSNQRILDIAAAIEEKRDILMKFDEFDPTPYTKLVLVSRDIASLKNGYEKDTKRCRRFLEDLVSYLTNNDLDLFLLAYGNALRSVIEEKYVAMEKVLQIQRENESHKRKNNLFLYLPFFSSLFKSHKEDDTNTDDSSSADDSINNDKDAGTRGRVSIKDFTFVKKISSGAYGRVFLARKNKTQDLYAVKVLLKEDTIRKNMIESVNAERKILSSVINPFVVNLYYAFQDEDYLYLVMEYCPGGDVGTLLKNLGAFDLKTTRTYAAEIVLALESLHSFNYVHRDLKPENLLISATGHIVLADFGLSSIGVMMDQVGTEKQPKDKASTSSKKTNHRYSQSSSPLYTFSQQAASGATSTQGVPERNRIVGTPDYLAPEVLCGLEHGPEVDWWALGVIVFEFIASVPPFNGDSPDDIFDNILDMRIPWPPTSDEVGEDGECLGFPSIARDFVEKLLVKDPTQRLGHNGAAEVKAHPFFDGIDWENLIHEPRDDIFVPVLDDPEDTSYFEDHGPTNSTINPSPQPSPHMNAIAPPPVVPGPILNTSTSSSPLLSALSVAAPFSPLAVASNPVVVDPETIEGFNLHSLQQQPQGQRVPSQQSSPMSMSGSNSPVTGSASTTGAGTAPPPPAIFIPQLCESGSGSISMDSSKKDKKKKKTNEFKNFEFVNTALMKKKNFDIVNGNAGPGSSPSTFMLTAQSPSPSGTTPLMSPMPSFSLLGPAGSGRTGAKPSPSTSPALFSPISSPAISTSGIGSSGTYGGVGGGGTGNVLNPISTTTITFAKSEDSSGGSDDDESDDGGKVIVINEKHRK